MKIKIATSTLLFFVTTATLAQLHKANLESKFPLLNLPYELTTEAILVPEAIDGRADFSKYPHLKDEVTDLVFGAMKDEQTTRKSVKTPNSKINAVGRISLENQNFIVYNLNDTRSDAYINVVYVASLDSDYNIVDISNILFFAMFNNPDNTSRTTQLFRKASISNGKLLLTETSRAIKNVDANQKETLNTQKSNKGYLFNKDGKIESLMIIGK